METLLWGRGAWGVHCAPVVSMEESGSGHVGGLKADFRGAESVGGSPWTASHRAFGAKQLGGGSTGACPQVGRGPGAPSLFPGQEVSVVLSHRGGRTHTTMCLAGTKVQHRCQPL